MKVIACIFVLFALAFAPAHAQQPQYAPPSAELWRQMGDAFAQLPISLPAHQQILSIVNQVEQQAIREQAAAAAQAAAKDKQPEPPK
jgi:hypothetical protein